MSDTDVGAGLELQEAPITRARASSEPGQQPAHYESIQAATRDEFNSDADDLGDIWARRFMSSWDPQPGFELVDGDVDGSGYNETEVDIIAVPCPGASPIDTWTRDPMDEGDFAKSQDELPLGKTLSPSAMRNLPKAGNTWICRGIRTKINTARVLLYRHRELSEGVTLESLADDLLNQLVQMRHGHQGARPIFFICHSIGGLVAKRALIKASQVAELRWIIFDCYGITFFATPHRGSSYLSMPNLRDSIQHLLHLSEPLPRSISDELRLNHRPLLKLHEQFMDLASEMNIWTFYETKDSQLSGLGVSDFDEVHFSAPLASIKSSLVGSRHEQAFSLECEHADCASFGQKNSRIMKSFLDDLSQAVQKAQKLSSTYVHTPLKLAEKVRMELIGFYEDPDPSTVSDMRLYILKPSLTEFLEKGPEKCLSERLNVAAPKPRRGSTMAVTRSRPASSSGLNNIGAGALGIWNNMQELRHKILKGGGSRPGSAPNSPEHAEGPEIVVKRPSVTDVRTAASEPTIVPVASRGLAVPTLFTPGFQRPRSRSSSTSGRASTDGTVRTLSDPTGSEISPRSINSGAPLEPRATGNIGRESDEHDSDSILRGRKDRVSRASVMQDLAAGFSRPDPNKRRFMWIHLPYNNPHWVKNIFDKLSETQHHNYARLLRNEYWTGRHVHGRHGQTHASYVRPGCGFVPAEAHSPHPVSPSASGRSSPALSSPKHIYLYLPYLHFDTYQNLIRRRHVMLRRMDHGRARPVPKDVAELPLDLRVIWEFIGHDPPLNTRRTLDQYGYPSLRDTYARDDDQMMYKRTKEQVSNPYNKKKTDMFGTRAMKEQSPLSPASQLASVVNTVKSELLLHNERESPAEVEDDLLDGNVLMVDQLWLWAVDMTTLTTFFPKRESHPTEGPMFQQADLRNSVYNELNGDLTGRCENALDLAAFITLHAVTVLLDRTSHPDLEIFRIFEEAIGILTERMTSSLKRFRMQTFRERIHESDSDESEYDDNRSRSIRKRHDREVEQAERENRENTSALLELRDMDDELKTLSNLFQEQTTVINKMLELYNKDELRDQTQNGRHYLREALSQLADYEKQVGDMMVRIAATRTDYEKLLEMVQRKAQVDEVRWSRLQAELASTQNLSVIIFTAFTVIFLPLSFFTSLFGMNTSDWAGDGGSAYMSLQTIGAISLPSSAAIIVLALIAAFSSRVQGAFKLAFEVLRFAWESVKGRLSKMRSDKHKESKLMRKRLKQERIEISRRKRERGYDFWGTVGLERRNEYQIPELNRKRATQRRLAASKTWRKGRWRDRTA